MSIIKVLRLILVIGAALGASTSAALASEGFTAAESPVKVTGAQRGTNALTIGASKAECSSLTLTTAEPEFIATPTAALPFSATYGSCTAFGFISAEVTMEGCRYVWQAENSVAIANQGATKSCEEKPFAIIVKSVGCEVTFSPQTLSGITYANKSGAVIATFTSKKLSYKSNEKGLGCPKNGEEAAYSGEIEVAGRNKSGETDAIEASSVSEPFWTLKKVALTKNETLSSTTGLLTVALAKPSTEFTCASVTIKPGSEILASIPGRDTSEGLTFAECGTASETAEVKGTCKVESFETKQLSSRLFYLKSSSPVEIGDIWQPSFPESAFKLLLTGSGCEIGGVKGNKSYTVNGSLIGTITPATNQETATVTMKLLDPSIERTVEGKAYGRLETETGAAVTIFGELAFELESKAKFGVK